jgi:hypothetical protein
MYLTVPVLSFGEVHVVNCKAAPAASVNDLGREALGVRSEAVDTTVALLLRVSQVNVVIR